MHYHYCPDCDEQLDYLDRILNKSTWQTYNLWICHNESCNLYGTIWNDIGGATHLASGDPSGLY